MSLLDTILNAQNGGAVQQIGAQLGLGHDQTTSALSVLIPALAAGVHQNVQSSNGLSGLLSALASGNHQQYVDNPASLALPSATADGTAILGHILGGNADQVASHAAAQTGLSTDVIKRLMPMAAGALMGAMASHLNASVGSAPQGGPAGLVGGAGGLMNLIAGTVSQGQAPSGGLMGGLLGRLFNQ